MADRSRLVEGPDLHSPGPQGNDALEGVQPPPSDPVDADHNQGIASGKAPVQAVPAVALVRAGGPGDTDVPVDVVPLDAGLAEPEFLAEGVHSGHALLQVAAGPVSDRKPWERQPGETAKAYAAFLLYRDLPAIDRSIVAAVAKQRKNGGKAPVRNWETWASRYNWRNRAAEHDSDLASRRRERMEKELDRSKDNAVVLTRAFNFKIAERIKGMDPEDLTAGQIPAALRTLPLVVALSAGETVRADAAAWGPPGASGPPATRGPHRHNANAKHGAQ